jgi:AraC-like DNA-binding protein
MRKQPARVSNNNPRRGGASKASGQFALTAAEVARAAGVSRSVVSRAFTPGAPIAEQTRAYVQKVARRLGYSPTSLHAA